MWSIVLWFALMSSLEPMRIGIAALLVSFPRPMLNLLAYWLGLMTMGFGLALAALFLLRGFTLSVVHAVHLAATQPVVPQIKIALGVLALLTAAMLARRSLAGQAAYAAISGGGPSALVLQPKTPIVSSPLSWWPAILKGGSPAMAFVAGLATATPPVEYGGAIIAILASGAGAGTQVSAALVFILVSFAIAEIPLVGYLASPAKTLAAVSRLQDWLRPRSRPIFVFLLGVMGVLMVAGGAGWV